MPIWWDDSVSSKYKDEWSNTGIGLAAIIYIAIFMHKIVLGMAISNAKPFLKNDWLAFACVVYLYQLKYSLGVCLTGRSQAI